MKQEEKKPQHFWVYGFNTGKIQISEKEVTFETEFFSFGDSRPLKPQFIYKLIEHSAYEKLQKENEQLKAKLDKAVEALKEYDKFPSPSDQVCCNNGVQVGEQEWACCNEPITLARAVLKEIEGE